MKRNLFFGALALILVPSTVAMVLRLMPGGGPLTSRTFVEPSHRVALATAEALKARLASVEQGEVQMTLDVNLATPSEILLKPDAIQIPINYPAFWTAMPTISPKPVLANLTELDFDGKTHDGRPIRVVVAMRGHQKPGGTIVTVEGDVGVARALLVAITSSVAHPKHPPGSPEEARALITFFSPPAPIPADPSEPAPSDPSIIKAASPARP